jgi:hypothetical protein
LPVEKLAERLALGDDELEERDGEEVGDRMEEEEEEAGSKESGVEEDEDTEDFGFWLV